MVQIAHVWNGWIRWSLVWSMVKSCFTFWPAPFQLATGHVQLLSYPFPTVTSSDNFSLLPKFAHFHFGSIRVKWYGLLIRTVDGTDLMSVPRPIFAQVHQASSIDEQDHVLGRPNFARFVRTVWTSGRPIFAPSPNYLQMVSKSLLDLNTIFVQPSWLF